MVRIAITRTTTRTATTTVTRKTTAKTKTQWGQGWLMLSELDVGVNDGGATSFGASTQAVRGGIFEELHKKDEIFYEALFWSEVRKAVDLRRILP